MEKIKLIILMPLYNREKWLAQALDSIFMQEVDFSYKIIIIDDCSTDKSLDIAKDYAQKHKEIEILQNATNCKLLQVIYKGYEKLENAEYFTVLDPDDYWTYAHKLQEAIDFLDNNLEYTIHATNIEVIDANGTKSPFIHAKIESASSSFDDYIAGRAVYLSCTQASIFRNVVFKNGLNDTLKSVFNLTYPEAFRADSFRNALHLELGKVYFQNIFTAVYNTGSEGLFTRLDKKRQVLLNTQALFSFSEYFVDKKDFYLGRALWHINPELEQFIQQMQKGLVEKEDYTVYEEYALLYEAVIQGLSSNNPAMYEEKLQSGKLKQMFETGKNFQKYLRIYAKKMQLSEI